ncbi:L,D-transpeptidase [Allosaccharopolyspora coralli]|nr:Ig-like domain-containing protein [Allosaccharopolyspora coralli]
MSTHGLEKRSWRAGLAALFAGTMLVGCTGLPGTDDPPPPPTPPEVTTTPGAGAVNVSPAKPVSLDVAEGTLEQVALTSSDGTPVRGVMSQDSRNWRPLEPLAFDETYTWSGMSHGERGTKTPVQGEFRTAAPAELRDASTNIGDGQTVGVAAPIIITFDGTVQDRAAVESRLSIWMSNPTEGSWAWLPDTSEGSRVHWRPKEYWPENTQVKVSAPLYGVDYGNGVYGKESVTLDFTIGRAQVTKADTQSHELVVMRGDQEVARYPASYGLDSVLSRNTRSGIHVVMGKSEVQRMISERWGYDEVHPWAVRISNNGEFIHTNAGSVGSQGSTNVSHGCINLSTTNGKEYFDMAMYGDPVEVTGSDVQLSSDDGDIYDWTIPWEEWQTMSALHQATIAPDAQPAPR